MEHHRAGVVLATPGRDLMDAARGLQAAGLAARAPRPRGERRRGPLAPIRAPRVVAVMLPARDTARPRQVAPRQARPGSRDPSPLYLSH